MAKALDGRQRSGEHVRSGEHLRAGGHARRLAPAPSHATEPHHRAQLDWRKRMSDNVATALLVYTGLQIFVTMQAMHSESGSILPYFGLVVLVAAIIPACRRLEKRWERLGDSAAADPALRSLFRRDQALLWLVAIGLPFAITAVFEVCDGLV